jgi:SAM-dependent methyltransferase
MGTSTIYDGSLLGEKGLRLDILRRLSGRPRVFSGRDRSFWTDPYVSSHVLEAHLDPHTDDASRRPQRIAATVEHIIAEADVDLEHASPRLLDLACGPGLYAEQFAARGFRVTGIDFATVSIEHARREAAKQGLEITYREADLLSTRFDGPYDVITMIYGEFCTLSDAERRSLLKKVRGSLAPGGLLAFDAFTEEYVRRNRTADEWYVGAKDGFWQAEPHLVLVQHFHYPARSASVARYTIVAEDGGYRQFNVWWRHFTAPEVRELLAENGFTVHNIYGSLWGEPFDARGEWMGVFARTAT